MKSSTNPGNIKIEERVIAGKKVKVASEHDVSVSAEKLSKKYDAALKNLKDR